MAGPEFIDVRDYARFARTVSHGRRYVWPQEVAAFLDTVRASVRDRDHTLRKGMILWRAQIGIDWQDVLDEDDNVIVEASDPVGFGRTRMRPRVNQSTEGRVNAAGVSMLYLASEAKTAVSEVRPWIGSAVSLAQFRVRRHLKALDLSIRHGKSGTGSLVYIIGEKVPDPAAKEEAVWTDIDNAFSRPVTRSDDGGDYAPTQVLAELFRDMGYDAIVFRSQFGERGFNLVLFDIADADPINCVPCEVTGIDVAFKDVGNRWFVQEVPEEPLS